jgi:hypothetical protein
VKFASGSCSAVWRGRYHSNNYLRMREKRRKEKFRKAKPRASPRGAGLPLLPPVAWAVL